MLTKIVVTILIKTLHPLVKNMYIMVVFMLPFTLEIKAKTQMQTHTGGMNRFCFNNKSWSTNKTKRPRGQEKPTTFQKDKSQSSKIWQKLQKMATKWTLKAKQLIWYSWNVLFHQFQQWFWLCLVFLRYIDAERVLTYQHDSVCQLTTMSHDIVDDVILTLKVI